MIISRSVCRYRARRRDQTPLINRIKEIAAARVRYDYQRVHILLRREGWRVNRRGYTASIGWKAYRCFNDALAVIVQRCNAAGRLARKRGTSAGAWIS